MASFNVIVEVDKSGLDDFGGDATKEMHLAVRKAPGCCMRCALNEDPQRVPLHSRCKCTVVTEEATSSDFFH